MTSAAAKKAAEIAEEKNVVVSRHTPPPEEEEEDDASAAAAAAHDPAFIGSTASFLLALFCWFDCMCVDCNFGSRDWCWHWAVHGSDGGELCQCPDC